MLLIITNRSDFASDFLISKLASSGLPYFRLNSEDIFRAEFTVSAGQNTSKKVIQIDNKTLDLNEVTAVWYRRAICPSVPSTCNSLERRFISSELKHLIEGAVLTTNAQWVNPMEATVQGERKLFQLEVALRVGLLIPESLITNSRTHALEFHSTQRKLICKPISHGLLLGSEDEAYAVHTNRVDANTLSEMKSGDFPVYLQKEIDRECDVRVTVVGSKVFPVEILHSTEDSPDWRIARKKLRYREGRLPEEIEGKILALMKRLNLVYAAVDLLKTRDGQYIFLEVNPAGEWVWLENLLGIPVSHALINRFYDYDE